MEILTLELKNTVIELEKKKKNIGTEQQTRSTKRNIYGIKQRLFEITKKNDNNNNNKKRTVKKSGKKTYSTCGIVCH